MCPSSPVPGPGPVPLPGPDSGPIDEGFVEARIRHLYDVFNQGDLFRLLDYFTPDVEIVHPLGMREIDPQVAGTKRGHAQVREFFERVPGSRGPMYIDPGEYLVSGNRAVVFGTRELHALDGRVGVLDFVHSWTLDEDGMVKRFEDHFDTVEMCRLLRPPTT